MTREHAHLPLQDEVQVATLLPRTDRMVHFATKRDASDKQPSRGTTVQVLPAKESHDLLH